jgi:hypothetical protein
MGETYKKLNPEKRREVNARYYQLCKARNPERKRRAEKAWRDRNRDIVNESAKRYYYANREQVIFKNWLYVQLMKIRKAVIARGLEPFDG